MLRRDVLFFNKPPRRNAYDEFDEWCGNFQAAIAAEKRHQSKIAERAKAVTAAAEAAEAAARAAAEEKRKFEREFGQCFDDGDAVIVEGAEKIEHKSGAAIEKYIGNGDDDADDITAMSFATFTKLNNHTQTPVTRDRYHKRATVTLASLREAKRQSGATLGAGGWDKYKKKIQARCEAAGRIMSFKTFFRENHAFITMHDELSKSDLWKQYNDAWDALCGTTVKRIVIDAPGKKRKHAAVAADAADVADEDA